MTRTRRPAPERPDTADLARRLDALARRRWTAADDGLARLTVGSGADEITVYGRPAAAEALLRTLDDAGEALDETTTALAEARREIDGLRGQLAALERDGEQVRAASKPRGARGDRSGGADTRGRGAGGTPERPATLENVPAALIAPFHPDKRTLAASKENPLVALAVQATKAMQGDAKELERARLLAMAYAASTGDMQRFWAARTQRSAKKL